MTSLLFMAEKNFTELIHYCWVHTIIQLLSYCQGYNVNLEVQHFCNLSAGVPYECTRVEQLVRWKINI